MVNSIQDSKYRKLDRVSGLVRAYVVVAVATIVVLAALTALAPDQATDDARVHAAIVAAFAVLLPLRLRSARRGSRQAITAVAIISGVLLIANIVEAVVPGLFPTWMRIEMLGIAALMAAVSVLALLARR